MQCIPQDEVDVDSPGGPGSPQRWVDGGGGGFFLVAVVCCCAAVVCTFAQYKCATFSFELLCLCYLVWNRSCLFVTQNCLVLGSSCWRRGFRGTRGHRGTMQGIVVCVCTVSKCAWHAYIVCIVPTCT